MCVMTRYYYTVDTKQKMFYAAITADLEAPSELFGPLKP